MRPKARTHTHTQRERERERERDRDRDKTSADIYFNCMCFYDAVIVKKSICIIGLLAARRIGSRSTVFYYVITTADAPLHMNAIVIWSRPLGLPWGHQTTNFRSPPRMLISAQKQKFMPLCSITGRVVFQYLPMTFRGVTRSMVEAVIRLMRT